jgi:hypothetical protein
VYVSLPFRLCVSANSCRILGLGLWFFISDRSIFLCGAIVGHAAHFPDQSNYFDFFLQTQYLLF